MITATDFEKKQIVFVFFDEGEKMQILNENVVVKDIDGNIKIQCSCYRVFLIYAVGHFTITSVVVQKAKKYGFLLHVCLVDFIFMILLVLRRKAILC